MLKNDGKILAKNIVLCILLIVLLCIIIDNSSMATNYGNIDDIMNSGEVDDTIHLAWNDLCTKEGNGNLYCIQKNWEVDNKGDTYRVRNVIRISGNVAKNKDGKSTSHSDNARLAFILGNISEHGTWATGSESGDHLEGYVYTARQQTLWAFWDRWIGSSGRDLGVNKYDSDNDGAKVNGTLWGLAESYANSAYVAEIASDIGTSINSDDEYVGPFKVTFTGKISSIVVKDANGNEITEEFEFIQDEKVVNISEITSGKEFFINNWSGKTFKDITVTVSPNNNNIKNVKLLILEPTTRLKHQRVMIVKQLENTSGDSASITIDISTNNNNTLRVVKNGIDGNKETRQTDVGFIISNGGQYLKYKNGDQVVRIGKMDYNETNFEWIGGDKRDEATIFETVNTDDGWKGYFQIEGMPEGNYYIGEVYNNTKGYESSVLTRAKLEKYKSNNSKPDEEEAITNINQGENISGYTDNKIQVMDVSLESGYTNVLRVYDSIVPEKEQFDIKIKKVNTANNPLYEAEFKIKVLDIDKEKENNFKGWLKKDSSGYTYEGISYENATTWKTSSSNNAQILIENLDKDNYIYEIYETKAANGYDLKYQETVNNMKVTIDGLQLGSDRIGYGSVDKGNNSGNVDIVYCGSVSYLSHSSGVNMVVTNVKEDDEEEGNPGSSTGSSSVDISGVVWMDRTVKTSNSQHDNEEGLSDVKVYLKRKSTNKTVKYKGKDYIQTDENGKYTFYGDITGIKTNTLSNYYIEIEYDGLGSQYCIVEYCKSGVDIDKQSRARYQSLGRAWTVNIDNKNRLYMNIGIRPLSTDKQSVTKSVENIQVKMKGYNYTYKYGENNDSVGGVGSVGVGSSAYHSTIYASDIAYSSQDGVTDGLEVYITYGIIVTNETTYTDADDSKEYFGMTAIVVDDYDENYYELVKDDSWVDKNGTATYDADGDNGDNDELSLKEKGRTGDSKKLSITFKLKKEALTDILKNGSFTAGNKVEISGEHKYSIYKYVGWDDQLWAWVDYTTSYGPEAAYAPGITFSIYEYDTDKIAERTISGKVFEDGIDQEKIQEENRTGEIIGDGKYGISGGQKENKVQNVTVELLQANSNKINGDGEIAKRYIYNDTATYFYEVLGDELDPEDARKEAKVSTNREGNYTFTGIIPGEYYVRFTYGYKDGTEEQVIIKTNPSGSKTVTAYEYKSTIITNQTLKDLIKKDRGNKPYTSSEDYWYRTQLTKKDSSGKLIEYSTAVDVLGDRETLNAQSEKTHKMRAYTPTFRISLENDTKNTSEPKKYDIKNMNFGIIETPEIELGFEKVMTNIRVTNSQGNTILDGNPGDLNDLEYMKELSNLDKKITHLTTGSEWAKIEINDEEIYGAEVEITYSITVINNSDVNYYEEHGSANYGYYYMFGEICLNPMADPTGDSSKDESKTKEMSITIKEVYDELDKKLTLTGNSHGISSQENNDLCIDGNWKLLYTQKRERAESEAFHDIATIIATRKLENDIAEDMEFKNRARVRVMEVTDNPKLIENVDMHRSSEDYTNYFEYEKTVDNVGVRFDNPSSENYLSVIPETGKDMLTPMIYIAVVALAGIIITIGIIVIKKKVLNK